jgi:L-amino acid N-acyltransferase YncA
MPSAFNRPSLSIRDALDADMVAVTEIYRHHVLHGTASFELVPPTLAEMHERRAAIVRKAMPYLVAEIEGVIAGYAYVTPYRPRPAYAYTVENSVYLRTDMAGRGAGSALLSALIERCTQGPWRQMIANVGDSGNTASLALHRKFGFRTVGTCECVGFKFGRWLDTVLLQRALGEGADSFPQI